MNTIYPSHPAVIADISEIDAIGNETPHGDHIITFEVHKHDKGPGVVTIDVAGWGRKSEDNLQILIELPELVAAISQATLHATTP